jgi:PAS domain S-box-containing protein
MAARLREQVVATDLATEERWKATRWPAMAMAYGLRSCWSTPVAAASGETLGVFAIYHEQPRSPTPQDLALIDQLTQIASITIERLRHQMSLAQAIDEIRTSEDRVRNIIDAVPGFVWSTAPDGRVDFLNQRWNEYTGMPLEEARGFGWTSAVHPDDAAGLATYWQALLEAGRPGEYEARLRRHDGAYRWFLIRAVPQRDGTGRLVKWYGANTDIEDRKQAERLLAGEKQLLGMMAGGALLAPILDEVCRLIEAILDGALCSIVLVDPRRSHATEDGTHIPYLQAGAAPHLPAALLEGIVGHAADARTCPVALATLRNEAVIATDLSRETRWEPWRSTALSCGIRANWSVPIVAGCGTVLGVLSILFREAKAPDAAHEALIARFAHLANISIECARWEAALRQSEAFLAKAQRLSLTGTFSWRVATDEITWSEEIYRIGEIDPDLKPTFDLIFSRIHPDDIPSLGEVFKRQRVEGRDFEHEHRLLMPDGRVKHVHLVAHATTDEDGGLEYIAALQDITQRRLSEEALGKVRSELSHVARVASLGALTASIAHEVNQPLAGIITNASTCLRMLAADPPNVDGARETARRTIRDGNRASEVIQRLRALFAKKDVSAERVDLNEATREVAAMLLGELQRHSVILQPDFAEALPPVRGDRVQLQQVIVNLILNAADAMQAITDRPHYLWVSTGLDESGRVYLEVRDNGTGFDDKDTERLFQAFYTTKHSGMGIGLSVSRSIIESHGGRLWATPNDGPGACFHFAVPAWSEAGADQHGAQAGDVALSGDPREIS